MDALRLRSGNTMPVMGVGTWMMTRDTAGTVAAALEMGYTMIDTSSDYGTQPGIAEGIRRGGMDRASLYIVTKVEETDDSYERTKRNLDELKLEYADLMLIHRPPRTGAGEELWRGLIRAKEDQLTRDIGVSNYAIDQMDALIKATGEVPVVNQIEWSPFGHSKEMLTYARSKGIVLQAYSPLTRAARLSDRTLGRIGKRHGKTAAQVMIRWSIQQGTVPLPKANKREHLAENINVFDFALSDDEMSELSALNERYSALGGLAYLAA